MKAEYGKEKKRKEEKRINLANLCCALPRVMASKGIIHTPLEGEEESIFPDLVQK